MSHLKSTNQWKIMLISQSFLKGIAAKWASPEEAHDARRVSVSRMKDQTSKSLYEQS